MKQLKIPWWTLYLSFFCTPGPGPDPGPPSSPQDIVKLVPASFRCNDDWEPKDIVNQSTSQKYTVVVRMTKSIDDQIIDAKPVLFNDLLPGERRKVGCKGCGATTTGRLCVNYQIVSIK